MSVPSTSPHPTTKPPTERKRQNQQLARFSRPGRHQRSFNDADIVFPNSLGDVGHFHSRQNGLVKRAVGFNFTNERIIRDGNLVEIQRRLLLFLERSRQLGFSRFGGVILFNHHVSDVDQRPVQRLLQPLKLAFRFIPRFPIRKFLA